MGNNVIDAEDKFNKKMMSDIFKEIKKEYDALVLADVCAKIMKRKGTEPIKDMKAYTRSFLDALSQNQIDNYLKRVSVIMKARANGLEE